MSQLENLKAITDKARECEIDPQMLLLAELTAKSAAPSATPIMTPMATPHHMNHQRYDILAKQVWHHARRRGYFCSFKQVSIQPQMQQCTT